MSNEQIGLTAPARPAGLREWTLLEMRRKRHAYPEEVTAIVDELLYLRRKHNSDDVPMNIPDLAVFLAAESEASRALWAERYLRAASAMSVGQSAEVNFGGHTYTLTKKVG
jgi:hypothetical protein